MLAKAHLIIVNNFIKQTQYYRNVDRYTPENSGKEKKMWIVSQVLRYEVVRVSEDGN